MTPHPPAAAILLGYMGLTPRTAAEVEDLYSRPASPPVAQGSGTGLGDR